MLTFKVKINGIPEFGPFDATPAGVSSFERTLADTDTSENTGYHISLFYDGYTQNQIKNVFALLAKVKKHFAYITAEARPRVPDRTLWRLTENNMSDTEFYATVRAHAQQISGVDWVTSRKELIYSLPRNTSEDVLLNVLYRLLNLSNWPVAFTERKLTSTTPLKWANFEAITKHRRLGIGEDGETLGRRRASRVQDLVDELDAETEEEDDNDDERF